MGGEPPATTPNKPKACARGVTPDAGSRDQQNKGSKRSKCSKRSKRRKQSGVAGSGKMSSAKLAVVDDSFRRDITTAHRDITALTIKGVATTASSITKSDNVLPAGSGTTSTATVCSVNATRVANGSDQLRPGTTADAPAGTHRTRVSKAEGTSQSSTAGELFLTEKVGIAEESVTSDSGPGAARFLAAVGFAFAATLCKEIGVTVFGLMAGADVVRFLDKSNCWQSRANSTAGDDASGEYTLAEGNAKYQLPVSKRRTTFLSVSL